jgi:RNA polymerase sigma-70 factor (ECF subfamily)
LWIYGVARKTLSNQRRSQHRSRALAQRLAGHEETAAPDTSIVVVQNDDTQDIVDAMDRLRDDDRELLRLAVWEDLPHADIAQIVQCSTHAVDQRLVRARKRLEKELKTVRRSRDRAVWMRTGGAKGAS